MTIILVLLLFGTFLLIDYVRTRGKMPQIAGESATYALQAAPARELVEGFQVPANLHYHAGHGWAQRERASLMRVGVDEFAADLLGQVDGIDLPKPGRWVRQGQKVWGFTRNGQKTEMVSPVEGEIVEVNPEVVKNPSRMYTDPFGQGWLMTVNVPDEESVQHNFMPERLVKDWIEDCAARLFAEQPQLAGPVKADGGRPKDFAAALPSTNWREVTQEFFLGA
jgi:glycine cleavage system H protein